METVILHAAMAFVQIQNPVPVAVGTAEIVLMFAVMANAALPKVVPHALQTAAHVEMCVEIESAVCPKTAPLAPGIVEFVIIIVVIPYVTHRELHRKIAIPVPWIAVHVLHVEMDNVQE